jgi:hypothetical protein
MRMTQFLDGYKVYDTSDGFGTVTEWQLAFSHRMGDIKMSRTVASKVVVSKVVVSKGGKGKGGGAKGFLDGYKRSTAAGRGSAAEWQEAFRQRMS